MASKAGNGTAAGKAGKPPAAPTKTEAKPAPESTKPVEPVVAAPKPAVPDAKPAEPAKPTLAAKPAAPARKLTAAKPVAKKLPAKVPAKPVAAKPANPIIKAAKSVVTHAARAAAVTPAARAAASTVQKETPTMATAFETPKFEAPKMFADFNDRTKAAVEKSQKAFEDANEMTKGHVEAMVESGKIAAKGFETLGHDAADYGRKSFESMTAALKNLAAVKSPADFFKLQSDYARDAFDAAVAQGSKNTETMIKLAGDAAQPIQNRFSVVADKVKAVA